MTDQERESLRRGDKVTFSYPRIFMRERGIVKAFLDTGYIYCVFDADGAEIGDWSNYKEYPSMACAQELLELGW